MKSTIARVSPVGIAVFSLVACSGGDGPPPPPPNNLKAEAVTVVTAAPRIAHPLTVTVSLTADGPNRRP